MPERSPCGGPFCGSHSRGLGGPLYRTGPEDGSGGRWWMVVSVKFHVCVHTTTSAITYEVGLVHGFEVVEEHVGVRLREGAVQQPRH